jgi:hypothetical protein
VRTLNKRPIPTPLGCFLYYIIFLFFSSAGSAGYDIDQWPYVTLDDYQSLARNVIDVSKGCSIGFAPFVKMDDVPLFNIFAANHYQKTRIPEPFPDGTAAIDDYGTVGIFSYDIITSEKYLDYTGNTQSWNSTIQNILAPMIQHSSGLSKKLMFNLHSSPEIGTMMEDMMVCAEETKVSINEYDILEKQEQEQEEELRIQQMQLLAENNNNTSTTTTTLPTTTIIINSTLPEKKPSLQDCTMVSDIKQNKTSWNQGEPDGPGASMMQPVFPANNKSEVRTYNICIQYVF